LGTVILAAGAALAFAASAQAETLKVVIPQKGLWDTSMVDFGVKQGFFKAEGLDIQTIYSQGGANTEQAVISGSADMAMATGFLGIISAYVKVRRSASSARNGRAYPISSGTPRPTAASRR